MQRIRRWAGEDSHKIGNGILISSVWTRFFPSRVTTETKRERESRNESASSTVTKTKNDLFNFFSIQFSDFPRFFIQSSWIIWENKFLSYFESPNYEGRYNLIYKKAYGKNGILLIFLFLHRYWMIQLSTSFD